MIHSAVEVQSTIKFLQDIPIADFQSLGLLHGRVPYQVGGEYGYFVFNNFANDCCFLFRSQQIAQVVTSKKSGREVIWGWFQAAMVHTVCSPLAIISCSL